MWDSAQIHVIDGRVGQGVKFERIRRITGYLVGTIDQGGGMIYFLCDILLVCLLLAIWHICWRGK